MKIELTEEQLNLLTKIVYYAIDGSSSMGDEVDKEKTELLDYLEKISEENNVKFL